jgi:UDP-N-acetylglucosamine--N-acetylmuramyl-(pentapeptide) pyrophosphoryl-undecaprenol N-acetylglucosamine transferase
MARGASAPFAGEPRKAGGRNVRVLMSGGGTAGHIYPALTVAERLVAEGHDVLYVGTPEGLESRLVPEAGIAFEGLRARGYDRSRPLSLISSSALMLGSTLRARALIRRFSADVVAGFGGYVSIPVGAGAALRRTPLALFEQNSVPGMANTFLSRWARVVGVTYDSSASYLKHPERALLTGNPVRTEVLAGDRVVGRSALGLPEGVRVVLVFGGSRGARQINSAMVAGAPRLLEAPDLHVVHVAGPKEFEAVSTGVQEAAIDNARYHVVDYIDEMGSALAAADLVIARAGATSIAEITALGRPAVLVPYPYATDDHQTLNAEAVVAAGGARLVPDSEATSPEFIELVSSLMEDDEARATMAAASAGLGRRTAAELVEKTILETVSQHA